MSPHGLDDGMAIDTGLQSGSDANHQGRLIHGRIQRSFSDTSIYQHRDRLRKGREPVTSEDRDGTGGGHFESLGRCLHQPSSEILDNGRTFSHGSGHGHRSSNGERSGKFEDDQRESRPVEAGHNPCGQVAATSHHHQVVGEQTHAGSGSVAGERLTWMISDRIDTAISSRVSACNSIPIGEWTRSRSPC